MFSAVGASPCCIAQAIMLLCKQEHSSGIWYTLNGSGHDEAANAVASQRSINMSKITAIALSPASTFFGRLVATIDRWLMAYAEMNIRNGDIPRCDV